MATMTRSMATSEWTSAATDEATGARIDAFVTETWDLTLDELNKFLRIPSVSAAPKHEADCTRAAGFVRDALASLGARDARVHPVRGPDDRRGKPIVTASLPGATGSPTVLVYGHYDVQPPEPLELWTSPPFEPTIRNGAIYARGSCDDKAQVWGLVRAIAAAQAATRAPLPVSLKFLIEGEEEIGSPCLAPFMAAHAGALAADVAVICDTSMVSLTCPSITTGLRGLVYLEVAVRGPSRDLHSGVFGGAVANPLNALARMLAALHDPLTGRVAVPGFYNGVLEPSDDEREASARAAAAGGMDADTLARTLGVPTTRDGGEIGYTPAERASVRPTVDINGVWGGYAGPGAKTVLPSLGGAKLSARLVPGQSPRAVADALVAHMRAAAPPGLGELEFTVHGDGSPGVLVSTETPYYRAASAAYESVFGRVPLAVRSGGSIPVVGLMKSQLAIDTLLLGFGLDSDNIHAPDEHYGLDNLRLQIRTLARWFLAPTRPARGDS